MFSKLAAVGSAVLFLAGACVSCASLATSPNRVVYQQGRTVIQLETDPAAEGGAASGGNSHPASLKPTQLTKLLNGVLIRNADGLLKAVIRSAAPPEPVFQEEELASLAPALSRGLAEANPAERVGFIFWSALPGRRSAPISGSISVQGPYVVFRLKEHPIVGWQDPENPPPPSLFELDYRQPAYLKPGSEEERRGSYKARPTVQIDYRGYLNALQDQNEPAVGVKAPIVSAPPVSASPEARLPSGPAAVPREAVKAETDPVKDLQRQVKELTDSNQELRARLREALDRQDQSRGVYEELARLRQELAETKQLLADKVLELNRLKNKAKGSDKGKLQPPTAP